MQEAEAEAGDAGRKSSATGALFRPAFLALLVVSLLVVGLGFLSTTTHTEERSRYGTRRELQSNGNQEFLRQACHATLYQEVCKSSISADSRSKNGFSSAYRIIELGIDIASKMSGESLELSKEILGRAGSDRNVTSAAGDCIQVLGFAMNRYNKCLELFSPTSGTSGLSLKDLQAWLSSVLAHQYDCYSALSYVNSSTEVQSTMVQVQDGMFLISNALAMAGALDNYGLNVSRWQPPPLKRGSSEVGGSEPAAASGLRHWKWTREIKVNQPKVSVVVSEAGDSDFHSIQEAIDSAPSNSKERFVIYIKEGTYRERVFVPETKTMIMLVGDGIDKTIITGTNYVQYGVTTMDTTTMLVAGDGFMARNLTISNTAGPEAHQAVALRIDADKVVIQSCLLVGFQDTLYSHTLRHYFVDSTITGTVDFIFGNSAAIFTNCKLLVRRGRTGIYTSMVTAHGRIDPSQTTGFAFYNCSVDTAPDFKPETTKYKAFLGRPWKMYSRCVFLNCYLGDIVPPQGWLPWKRDFALETLLFGEYQSHGPGADDLSQRVPWSTQLNQAQALEYSVHNFIQGESWILR